MTPVQLASEMQVIVDQLFDLRPQWEGDHRVMEVVDPQRLNDLTVRFCSGRDTGLDF